MSTLAPEAVTPRMNDLRNNESRPFVLRFRTPTFYYVYDVNLNSVLKVDAVQYDIVEDLGVLDEQEMVLRYQHRHPPEAIRSAFRKLASAHRAHGYFSNNRPRNIVYMLDETSMRKLYEEAIDILTLGVTEQCNLRCAYCVFSGTNPLNRQHNPLEMSAEILDKALTLFERHSRLSSRVSLAFYGGEPLLNLELIKCAVSRAPQVLGSRPISYQMTTNATLLSDEVCDFLIANGFHLQVSLDGPQELHDRYRRTCYGNATFDLVTSHLRRLQKRAPAYYAEKVAFNMVLAPPHDYEALETFLTQDPLVAHNRFRIGFLSPVDTTFYNRLPPEVMAGARVFDEKRNTWLASVERFPGANGSGEAADRLKQELFRQPLGVFAAGLGRHEPFAETVHPGGFCVPGVRKLYVSADGRLFPCEKVNTTSDLLCLGDVDSGLDVARAYRIIQEYSSVDDRCRSCPALRHCDVCFLHCDANGRFDRERKGRMCDLCVGLFQGHLREMMRLLERNSHALDFARDIR